MRPSLDRPGPGLRRSYLRSVAGAGLVQVGVCALLFVALPWERWFLIMVPSWLWFGVAARWTRGQLVLVRPSERGRLYDHFLAANTMTLFRLLAAPLLGLAVAFRGVTALGQWTVFLFFIVCAATDVLDGWLARSRNELSIFGRTYDHVTDIIFGTLVSMALWWSGLLPSWFFVLCMVRFLLPVFGGGWLYIQHVAWRIEPSVMGKVTVSSLALLALLYLLPDGLAGHSLTPVVIEGLLNFTAFLVGINLVYLLRRGVSILLNADRL